jgi:hypothetical protein
VKIQRMFMVVAALLLLVSLGFGEDRTEQFNFNVPVVGQKLGSCDGFDVLTDYEVSVNIKGVLDKQGQLAKSRLMAKSTAPSVYYNSTDRRRFLMGGPAEQEIDHINYVKGTAFVSSVMWKVTVPGYGVVYMETGRVVCDPNSWECFLNTNTGHNQYYEKNVAAMCEILK